MWTVFVLLSKKKISIWLYSCNSFVNTIFIWIQDEVPCCPPPRYNEGKNTLSWIWAQGSWVRGQGCCISDSSPDPDLRSELEPQLLPPPALSLLPWCLLPYLLLSASALPLLTVSHGSRPIPESRAFPWKYFAAVVFGSEGKVNTAVLAVVSLKQPPIPKC